MNPHDELAKVSDQRGVRSLVARLIGDRAEKQDGLSFELDGETVKISSEWWRSDDYRSVCKAVEKLLAGTDVKGLEGVVDETLALIEKAPEIKFPNADARELRYSYPNVGGSGLKIKAYWAVPILLGERDTNLSDGRSDPWASTMRRFPPRPRNDRAGEDR